MDRRLIVGLKSNVAVVFSTQLETTAITDFSYILVSWRHEPTMRFQPWAVLVLISWPGAVAAGQDSATVRMNRQAAIQALHPGRRIRLATPRGEFEGAFTGADAALLWITRDSAVTAVGLADIDALWIRGRATKTGALVGTLAGAVIGVAFGVFIGEVVCNDPDCRANTAEVVVVLGLGGAAAGGLAGTIIGLGMPRWHQRFP